MTSHTVRLDVTGHLAEPEVCPTCGSRDLRRVSDARIVNWVCAECGSRWTFALGGLVPADRDHCVACRTLGTCDRHGTEGWDGT